jgi:hypothetical protein
LSDQALGFHKKEEHLADGIKVRTSYTGIKRTELEESGLASVPVEALESGTNYATSTTSDSSRPTVNFDQEM